MTVASTRPLLVAALTALLSDRSGGLAASVPHLAHSFARSGAGDFHVIGSIDGTDPEAARNWAPTVHALHARGPSAFGYNPGMSTTLAGLAPDLIDVQGLWMYPSLASLQHHRRHGTPYVITPRGMLDPWARRWSTWKKRIARAWFEDTHLAGATCLRATAEMEAEHFRDFGLRNPIAIVPNGVELPSQLAARPRGRRRLLFLSRIHPKKGIDYLLQAWSALEDQQPDWDVIIAGPDEAGYTAEMQALARRLGLRRVRWLPAVHGTTKSDLYRSADCFVLPTHAENFGLVVAEALAHEVPVITTKNAPWKGLISHRCGWWIDLDQTVLRQTLVEVLSCSRDELCSMGARGRTWMARDFGWDGIATRMSEVYTWCVGKGPKPDCVVVD